VGRGGESGFYYALGDSISNNKPDGVAHVFPTLLSQKLGIPLKMLAEPGSSAERVLTAQVPAIGRDCVLVTAVVANMEGYNAWLRRFVAVNGALLVDLDEDTRFKDPPFPLPYMYRLDPSQRRGNGTRNPRFRGVDFLAACGRFAPVSPIESSPAGLAERRHRWSDYS
jgi:hypothetical protein